MDIGAGSWIIFCTLIGSSAPLALMGTLFRRGELLDLITLIDLSKHDRAGIAKISSMMMFTMALSLSVAATLSFWVSAPTVVLGALAAMILICLIGYILMARVPKVAA
jgi:hypothetical protein